MAKSGWVPRGNGYTWVDDDGYMLDDENIGLSEDGIHPVNGSKYLFKGGLVQTGFVYFDADDSVTKAKLASYARYFNTPDGELQKYEFLLDGKKYIPVRNGMDAKITLSGIFESDGSRYYADEKGAVVLGPKIVTDGNNVSYYVDKDGKLLNAPAVVLINGRAYHVDEYGKVVDLSEGQAAHYYYKDENKNNVPLYLKFAKAGKPTDGTFFYSDETCKNKVTSQWIYKTGDTLPSIYLDKSGKPASGLVKIDGKNYFFDPDNGCELVRHDPSLGGDAVKITYKGKNYALDERGAVITDTPGFIKVYPYPIEYEGEYSFGEEDFFDSVLLFYVRVKKTSGELMTGIQSIDGHKYLFSRNAELQFPGTYGLMFDDTKNHKAYMPNNSINYEYPETYYIYVPGKTELYTVNYNYGPIDEDEPIADEYDEGRTFVVNKDGSVLMNGWATIKNENNKNDKYYVLEANLLRDEGIYKIGSKYYSFNSDGTLHYGWKRFGTSVFVGDVSTLTSKEYYGDFCFFFNEKTGAMETGWKTMNTVQVDKLGNIVDKVDGKVTGPKKKIYFNTSETGYLPLGALAINADLKISGKTYRFGADGSVEQGEESFVYGDPRAESFDSMTSYKKADGTMARGRTLVNTGSGSYYFYFSLTDGRKETGVLRKTGSKWYYYGPNGCMSTTIDAFHAGDNGDSSVIANFNADGSIKNFSLQNGVGTVLKNTVIVLDTEGSPAYVLDKNGKPMTGLVKLPNTTVTLFYESDGSNMRSKKTEYGSPQLRRIGQKCYMFINDILINKASISEMIADESLPEGISYDRTNDLISVLARKDTFDLLSSSDRAEADRCLRIFKVTPGLPDISILLNSDGTVKSGDVSSDHGSFRCNKLGIVMDGISLFVKKGAWSISSYQSAGSAGSRTVIVENLETYSIGELIISWDSTGKLLPIIDKQTGKPATGKYFMDDVIAVISVKKGKLATGKVDFMFERLQLKIAIDKDYGIGLLPFYDD
jgi:glucan-binding YG repeat protein